jgi:hypothetical protein
LFSGTRGDNAADCATKERRRTKISADQVREIRLARKNGTPVTVIAAQFSLSIETIYKIVRRALWKHVV